MGSIKGSLLSSFKTLENKISTTSPKTNAITEPTKNIHCILLLEELMRYYISKYWGFNCLLNFKNTCEFYVQKQI
jgi:hypothetical protein